MTRVNVSIDVPDLDAGIRFYGRVFGWTETARPFPTMAVIDGGNVTFCMHAREAGSSPAPGASGPRTWERHWTPVHLDLHVDDFDEVLARVRAEGGAIEREFRDGPHPDTAFCADPFGTGFCVIGPRRGDR